MQRVFLSKGTAVCSSVIFAFQDLDLTAEMLLWHVYKITDLAFLVAVTAAGLSDGSCVQFHI